MSNLNEEIASMLSGSVSGQINFEGGGGTSNYNDLINKPKINNVELTGNKTTDDLGLFDGDYNNLDNKPTIPPAPVLMVGATTETDGTSGYVPQPLTSDVDKFLNGAGEWVTVPTGQINYSTTEQIIGTWIDGKPLYVRVVPLVVNLSANSWVQVSGLDSLNMDTCISVTLLNSNNNTTSAVQIDTNSSPNEVLYMKPTGSFTTEYFILEYTKTTE